MQSRQFLSIFLAFLLALSFYTAADSQTKLKIENPDVYTNEQSAVARLRELYIGRDFETGYELGQKLAVRFPASVEVKAWMIVNMARNDMPTQAVEAAKKLVAANRENGWANFALAHAYVRSQQTKRAIPIVEKVFNLLPDNEEVVFLNTSLLLSQKKYDEIYALLDKNSAAITDQARSLYIRGEAEYRQAFEEKNPDAKKKQSFESFAKAIKLAPNSVGANYVGGVYLYSDKRFAEALPVLKKAVSLAPQIAHVRQAYWRALLAAQPKKTADQKNAEVIADINEFLRLRPNSPNAFDAAASFYGRELQMPDKKTELEQKIVEKFPESSSAEQILYGQIKDFNYIGADNKIDEKKKAEYFQKLKDFFNRPQHFNATYLTDIDSQYFSLARTDKNITNTELLQIAEKISSGQNYYTAQMHSTIVFGLIERQMFREAGKFADAGFEKLEAEIERQRESGIGERQNQEDLTSGKATLHAAKGWLFFKQNRLEDAEKELLQAIKLEDGASYYYGYLGQVYEAENALDKAEDAYINAYSMNYGKAENLEKIKSFYQKRNGNLNNFDEYFERVKVVERARRKERITKARIENAEPVAPFVLKNLDAKIVSSADLRGKIVVVNVWGTWCAPCVRELPEFQALSKKYQNDKDVVILTINNDEDVNLLKNFMTAKKYDFTVLRDEKYLDSVGVSAFPTTWFIDRDGKIAYVKIGMSDKLTEEFGWRIEELKNQH